MDFAVTESKFRFQEIKFEDQETKLLKFFEFWKMVVLELLKRIRELLKILIQFFYIIYSSFLFSFKFKHWNTCIIFCQHIVENMS